MTPPFRRSGAKRGSSQISEVTYNMEDESAYSFCMFGVVKTGEAFEVVLVVKARWGREGKKDGAGILYTRDFPGYVESEGQAPE